MGTVMVRAMRSVWSVRSWRSVWSRTEASRATKASWAAPPRSSTRRAMRWSSMRRSSVVFVRPIVRAKATSKTASTATAAARSTTVRAVLEGSLETSTSAERHSTELIRDICVHGVGIDFWRIGVLILGGRLLLANVFACFSLLLLLLLLIVVVGILTAICCEEGVVFDVGHEVPEWVGRRVEVVDGRHDVCMGREE